MWIVLAALSFLCGQVYLFRCLKKLDEVLDAMEHSKENAILSVTSADPDLHQQMSYLLERYSLSHPGVNLVLHTDSNTTDAVLRNKADVAFCRTAVVREGLNCMTLCIPGEPAVRMVWKDTDKSNEFAQYLWQACGNNQDNVV